MKRKESKHTATKEIKSQKSIVGEEEAEELQNSQKKKKKAIITPCSRVFIHSSHV